ncbi:MAG TPA: HIT domain-containing protein, partial [Anaerolineae bacterium]|nr:HIT domain-containing protein [Anaerolineae bacterium]
MRKLLFSVARSRWATIFIGFAFARLSWLMPLKRIDQNELCVVFLHPVAFWQVHWLGVPKRAIASFMALDFVRDGGHIVGILQMLVQSAEREGIRPKTLLVNGGAYQDVPQLHFHLASGLDNNGTPLGTEKYVQPPQSTAPIVLIAHPDPTRPLHWQFSAADTPPLTDFNWSQSEKAILTQLLCSV